MSESAVERLSEVVFVLSAPLFAPRVRVVALLFEDFRHGSDPIGVIRLSRTRIAMCRECLQLRHLCDSRFQRCGSLRALSAAHCTGFCTATWSRDSAV